MARRNNSKIHNVYLLSKDKLYEKFVKGSPLSIEDIIDKLMDSDECNYYEEQRKKSNIYTSSFSVRLYFAVIPSKYNKLSSFCSAFIEEDQDVISFHPKNASSVLFVWNETNIFAITSGQGYHIIQPYCVPKFGMMVAAHYLEYLRITALDSNEIAGSVHSSKTIYSNEMNFIDVDSLDTIYKEVAGRLNNTELIHELLDLDDDDRKNSVKIIAKDYLQLSNSMNFDKLIHLLTMLSELNLNSLEDRFNAITPLNPKRNKAVIEKNNNEVIASLYHSVQTNRRMEFDLFNKNTNQFIEADRYEIVGGKNVFVSKDEIETLPFISEAFTNFLSGRQSSLNLFAEFVHLSNIEAYKGDDRVCKQPLLEHLYGEITVDDANYFIVYGDYYLLTNSYCDRLNQIIETRTNSHIKQVLSTPWVSSKYDEDMFNGAVAKNEGLVLLHRILVENIEFADLLKYENGEITIIHVKDGFDGEMRALDRQVELSIKMLNDLVHNNYENYFRSLYVNATSSDNEQSSKLKDVFKTADDFIKALKTCTIKYCIAIRPANVDLAKNRSNIAKHCLNALLMQCAVQDYELIINIIKTTK